MSRVSVFLCLFVLTGCVNTKLPDTPRAVPIPARAKPANTSPVERGVDRVDVKLQEARRSADRLAWQLGKAKDEARTASERASSAYLDGVQAGSLEAQELKDSVAVIEVTLQKSEEERTKLSTELAETEGELITVRTDLGVVRSDLSKMESEAVNLRLSLTAANESIHTAAKSIDDLKTKTASLQANLDSSRKWMWRWVVAFFFLAALNAVYIAGRINGWGWIR